MSITVLFFASLREELGQSRLELPITQATSAADIWQQATQQSDMPSNIRIAHNQEYCSADTMINVGDEVAFFPPVTGG